jgi:hypothetical protein
MRHVTGWGWYWLGCLAAIIIPEVYWAAAGARNTISATIWGAEGIDLAHPLDLARWTPLHWAISVLLLLLFGWLLLHLTFGWLR